MRARSDSSNQSQLNHIMSLLLIRPLLRLWHKTHVCLIRTVSIVDGETSPLIRE